MVSVTTILVDTYLVFTVLGPGLVGQPRGSIPDENNIRRKIATASKDVTKIARTLRSRGPGKTRSV